MSRPALTESAVAWDLRSAWGARHDVGLSLRGRGEPRLRGYVERVAATDSYALLWDGVELVHVPLARVLAVHRPHMHEPAWGDRPAPPPPRRAIPMLAGQLSLFEGYGRPDERAQELAARRAAGKIRSESLRR